MERALEVERQAKPVESGKDKENGMTEVMTTRYCLRRELGVCLRDRSVSPERRKLFCPPLTIATGPHKFRLDFDCARCEMRVSIPVKD